MADGNRTARWGEEDDDEGFKGLDTFLPPNTSEGPDKKGIKTITEYEIDDAGVRWKTMHKLKIVKRTRTVSKAAKVRRELWKKFGDSANDGEGPNTKNTVRSRDEVRMEHPDNELKSEKAEAEQMMKHLQSGIMKRQLRKQYEDAGLEVPDDVKEETSEGKGLRRGPIDDDGKKEGASGRYVPPNRAGGARPSYQDRDDSNTLRMTNISEDATQDDLNRLFQKVAEQHGIQEPQRLYLAKDRVTFQSRGFAFVTFTKHKDAEKAMEVLNGYGYDHLILKVEWSQPSERPDPGKSSGLSGGYTSGYGRALPQGLK